MIRFHGTVEIPAEAVQYADGIKQENYKVNTPAEFQVRVLPGCKPMLDQLATLTGQPRERMDAVYFSCPMGSEPHTDKLNLKKFENTTFIIPVILPDLRKHRVTLLTAGCTDAVLEVGGVYEFDHTQTHSLTVGDDSGCVLIMVALLKEQA
jgi:hypothetical protein